MALHQSNDYATRPVPRASPAPGPPPPAPGAPSAPTLTDYLGPGEEAARVLSEVAHGGQVLLSEAAWAAVQDRLPGQPQASATRAFCVFRACCFAQFFRPILSFFWWFILLGRVGSAQTGMGWRWRRAALGAAAGLAALPPSERVPARPFVAHAHLRPFLLRR
jgi:hypothetical protein